MWRALCWSRAKNSRTNRSTSTRVHSPRRSSPRRPSRWPRIETASNVRPSASSCPTSAKPSARTLARIARSSPGSVLPRSVSATSSTKVSKSCRAPVRVSPVSDLGESEALASRAERVDHGQTALERMDEVPAAPLQIVRFSIRNVPSRARTRVSKVAGRPSQTARSTRASSIPSLLNTLPSAARTCGERPSVVVAKALTSVSTLEPGNADLLARSPARPRVKPVLEGDAQIGDASRVRLIRVLSPPRGDPCLLGVDCLAQGVEVARPWSGSIAARPGRSRQARHAAAPARHGPPPPQRSASTTTDRPPNWPSPPSRPNRPTSAPCSTRSSASCGRTGLRRHHLHPSLARSRAIVRRARSGTPPRRPSSSTVQA